MNKAYVSDIISRMENPRILVINPGSTSTKLACFEGGSAVCRENCEHSEEELARFPDIPSQEGYRFGVVEAFMVRHGILPEGIDAVAARGGLMKPVRSGVYRINRRMVEDLLHSKTIWGREHASNLGCILALRLSEMYGLPAFTADPVTVDEMADIARVSGFPDITRKSHLHALNIKAMAGRAAAELGIGLSEARLVVAHLGGGISVAAVDMGRIIDVNNALLGMGPFSPQRAGALPIGDLVDICYSGRYDKAALLSKLAREGGLQGYLGISDIKEVERRIGDGDVRASLIFSAMAYQVSKEIAAMAAALSGRVDAVVLTGGAAHSSRLVAEVGDRVAFIARLLVYPGEAEMEALAAHAAGAMAGEEEVLSYE